ncbi:TPA: CTP synthase (glutamine hydrolyzing) [Candidatus Micrarchaeota archaeon]|nr:CTP synthase (glutamine hydrolyzing) [Candidatus Micrarchaeota archaeon]
MAKYVFVTGGVLSSLGKGTLSSSIARILKSKGANANCMKIDPYLNCDAGTLNPFEHGEVFVTQDGFECDLDVGNYERFLNIFARREQNFMMGQAYKAVIEKERKGDYLGKTLQMIPHVTNEVKRCIRNSAKVTGADVLVVELGGTVGDIESEVVLEAIRQMRFEGDECVFIHLALVPTVTTGEQKTKPLQHSVKMLLASGIQPDIIVARSEKPLGREARAKIAMFCNVAPEAVFYSANVDSVYKLPLVLQEQEIHRPIAEKLSLKLKNDDLVEWKALLDKKPKVEKTIAVVGKYATTKDTYMSVFEALAHAALHNGVKLNAVLIDSEKVEAGTQSLEGFDAFVVPGGWGERGVEGIIKTIQYAREKNLPYLGLCYGLQLAIVEFARNVLGFKDANTAEINPNTKNPVICILPEQREVREMGGTTRLGAFDVKVLKNTLAFSLYKDEKIYKRFRHRYEINPEYVDALEKAGWVFSGRDPKREIMKIGELKTQEFHIGSQFHPEFDSRLEEPEPLFDGLVKATLGK